MRSIDQPVRSFGPISLKDRFPALDGLRAFAVTAVFLHHFGGGSHGGYVLHELNAVRLRGWVGVDLFFALSGFLITGILYDTRHDSRYFLRFFGRRSLRIFPIFYLVAAILLLLTPILHYQWRAGHLLFLVYLGNFLGNYDFSYYDIQSATYPTFKATIGHFWSLCVEEQFYLLWPVAVWFVKDRIKIIWTATAFSVLALGLRTYFYMHTTPEMAERWIVRTLPFRMDVMLLGGVLALLLRGPASTLWQRSCRYLLIVFGSIALYQLFFTTNDGPAELVLGGTVNALACVGLIGCTLRPGAPMFRIFNLGPLRTLGKYSYGFYVYHLLFAWAWIQFLVVLTDTFHSRAIAGVLALSINFAVTFLVAKLSYDYFESRFLQLKSRFAYDSEIAEKEQRCIEAAPIGAAR